jgi:hypothetical protein
MHYGIGVVPARPYKQRAEGSLRSLLARVSRIDVVVIDDWAMAPLSESERRYSWGDLRGSLPRAFDHPHCATTGRAPG